MAVVFFLFFYGKGDCPTLSLRPIDATGLESIFTDVAGLGCDCRGFRPIRGLWRSLCSLGLWEDNFAMNKENKTEPSSEALTMMNFENNKKSEGVAFLLWFFLGLFGAHRFYP